ncbi:hypothetical protein J6590_027265 [Homalodisca vitripennis]|nr:hypothetical protein J6590_027265 [Homalodisca vitripennis]
MEAAPSCPSLYHSSLPPRPSLTRTRVNHLHFTSCVATPPLCTYLPNVMCELFGENRFPIPTLRCSSELFALGDCVTYYLQ